MGEEGTTLPFRLFDFLAYLFPGAVTMHAVYLMRHDDVTDAANAMSTKNVVIDVLLGFIAAYIIGLIWSVISRQGLRSLVWRYCNPRIDYFSESNTEKSPLGMALNRQLRENVQKIFGPEVNEGWQAHRLCRAFVSKYSSASWERRESFVGVRAMCANCFGPVLLYAVAFAMNGLWPLSIVALVGSMALIQKMIILDQREWKEIYFAFLVVTASSGGGMNTAGGEGG